MDDSFFWIYWVSNGILDSEARCLVDYYKEECDCQNDQHTNDFKRKPLDVFPLGLFVHHGKNCCFFLILISAGYQALARKLLVKLRGEMFHPRAILPFESHFRDQGFSKASQWGKTLGLFFD